MKAVIHLKLSNYFWMFSNILWLYSGSDNRFKGLDLVDRLPEELWTEVCNTVKQVVSKPSPRKRCNQAKWLSEEALQIAEKRREVKGKGERERQTQLKAEFQRIARRDKKAFLSETMQRNRKNRIGKNKASGGYRIAAKLFKILKDAAALNMSANLKNSAVLTGMGKVSFHSNPKEEQCQRMFKLPYNCTHFTC